MEKSYGLPVAVPDSTRPPQAPLEGLKAQAKLKSSPFVPHNNDLQQPAGRPFKTVI